MRFLLLLIPLALAGGIGLGLSLAWGPLASTPGGGASPAELRRSEKEEYLRYVAAAFAEEQDVRRARARLEALGAGNAPLWVAELARRDASSDPATATRLARLAAALGVTDAQTLQLATPVPGEP